MKITTNMPGFSADATLYNTRRHYRKAGNRSDFAGSPGVIPQLPIGFCMADCDFVYQSDPFLRDVCKLGCLGGGDGGGTGGGGATEPHCRPHCTPCRRDLASETGRSRTCLTFDCESNTVAC
jgi:hypothetical protein